MIYSIGEIQKIVTPIAIKYELKAVYLFGSYARGVADESSDIDLLIDTTSTSLTSLFKLGMLYSELQSVLNKELDLVTLSSIEQNMNKQSGINFMNEVEKEKVSLYAAA